MDELMRSEVRCPVSQMTTLFSFSTMARQDVDRGIQLLTGLNINYTYAAT